MVLFLLLLLIEADRSCAKEFTI